MKFHTSYDVSPKLQEDSVRQYYWHALLRPRIGLMVVSLALMLCGVALLPQKGWVVGFVSAVIFFMIIASVGAYYRFLSQARAGLKLMENPKVEISMDDSLIEYASSSGTRRHQ